jgi:hypothetical protein
MSPLILNVDVRWKCVVNVISRPLCTDGRTPSTPQAAAGRAQQPVRRLRVIQNMQSLFLPGIDSRYKVLCFSPVLLMAEIIFKKNIANLLGCNSV